jgi:hypothetical protein
LSRPICTRYRPLLPTIASGVRRLITLPAASSTSTRLSASPDPMRNGAVTLVMLSPATPESLSGARVGASGVVGGVVSMTTRSRSVVVGPTLPARSIW